MTVRIDTFETEAPVCQDDRKKRETEELERLSDLALASAARSQPLPPLATRAGCLELSA